MCVRVQVRDEGLHSLLHFLAVVVPLDAPCRLQEVPRILLMLVLHALLAVLHTHTHRGGTGHSTAHTHVHTCTHTHTHMHTHTYTYKCTHTHTRTNDTYIHSPETRAYNTWQTISSCYQKLRAKQLLPTASYCSRVHCLPSVQEHTHSTTACHILTPQQNTWLLPITMFTDYVVICTYTCCA